MPVRFSRLVSVIVGVSAVFFFPSFSSAQLPDARCLSLFQQYLDATTEVIDFEGKDRPHAGQPNFEQRISEWNNQLSDHWSRVVDTGRKYLGNCQAGKSEPHVLRDIAEGLRIQNNSEDALPIIKRCLSKSPEDSSCWLELGMIEEAAPICRNHDAKEAFHKVIEIGGFTEVNAGNVKLAKSEIEFIDDIHFYRTGCPPKPAAKPTGTHSK
jgi:hypothetical protein